MIRVSELSGAWLDYWVARAEGIPADQLEVRQVQRSEDFHCVYLPAARVLNFSICWSLAGPLLHRERIGFGIPTVEGTQYQAFVYKFGALASTGYGETHLVAAARCMVACRFGKEVPEVAS